MIRNIDIVIPVLNEQNTLSCQIYKTRKFIDEFLKYFNVQLIIADNGSTDKTSEIGKTLENNLIGVKYLRVNDRGVGRALKLAWGRSDADIIGYMDLDLATDLSHLPQAIAHLCDGADVVTGSRLMLGAKVEGRRLIRTIASRSFNRLVQIYLGVRFTDGQCGFKFLRREHLQKLVTMGAISNGWFFATELLVCAERSELKLVDLPVNWRDDPDSRAQITKLTFEYLMAMRALKKRLAP